MDDAHDLDDRLRAVGHAARAEAEARLDLDAELAAVLAAGPVELPTAGDPSRPVRSRGAVPWLAAAAAVIVAVTGGVLLLRRDDSLEVTGPASTDPSTTLPVVVAPPPTSPASVPPSTVTETTQTTDSTAPTTTVVPVEALIRPGSIDLGPDDVIARAVDGDVWWYPGALGETPGERILLIDRDDPRPEPEEGTGPNSIDHVAGTFDGSLIYGDCCEPVSGNLFAITEPGAEADFFADPVGQSELAQVWGVGYAPTFEPDGTRIVAVNWDYLEVTDLASGARQSLLIGELGNVGGYQAAWADGSIAALMWSFDDGLFLSVRDPADLTTELARVPLAPVGDGESPAPASIVGVTDREVVVRTVTDDGTPELTAVAIGTWATSIWQPPFDVPVDATELHLAEGGGAMAWVVGEQGIVQRADDDPVLVDDGLAEVWLPDVRGVVGDGPEAPAVTTGTTVVATVPPTTVPSLEPIDWRDLPSEISGISNSCVRASLNCTRVIHDPAGTPISYDPNTRVLTRHGVPAVTTTLPDSYGLWPWLYHAGPDGVVYLQVDPAVPAELAADLVAVTLTEGDAGREVDRWDDVVNAVGDDELVATTAGLVSVGCCGPDQVRPSPDAPVDVPWVNRTTPGTLTYLLTPTIRSTQTYPDLTIARTDVWPAGTRDWTFRAPDDWLGRGMPQVTPTFDGGFVAALQVSDGHSIVRGWVTGEVEQVTLSAVHSVALDPLGRVLIGDGDRLWRVEPFADRTPRLAHPPEVDVDTGTITFGAMPDLAADWQYDPVAFADVLAGPVAVNEVRTIDAEQRSESEWLVTVVTSNFFDDSVFAVRWELTLSRDDAGRFSFESGTWANACQPGRGHQDFDDALCA